MMDIISSLPPFWVHFCLIGGDVAATVAVGVGIIWESPQQSQRRHEIAHKFVIWGIVAETLCSVCLFAFDESISHAQEAKIIALEEQITPRRISYADCLAISDSVKSVSGHVVVASYVADLEGGNLAWQITDCLNASKSIVAEKEIGSILPTGGFGVGVFVTGPNNKLASTISDALAQKGKVLVGAGNGFLKGNMRMGPEDASPADATVLIAIKPLP